LFDYEIYVSIDRFESVDVVGDAETLSFASGKADTVLCTETLEHLAEPQRALAEINRLLNAGGCPILTVPLVWGEHNYHDHQCWTEMGLRRMLKSAGFEIQVVRCRGRIFPMVGCLMTRIPHQVFGKLEDQRSRLLKGVYILCWLVTIPIPWILALLDPLDRLKAFTLGYSVLCRKKSDPL
jgi:ubiquinone/menaquinone biosynthesis C-methylase UbiE